MWIIWGLKNCDTCRKAVKWLTEQGEKAELKDYRATPIAPTILQTWAQQAGGWRNITNPSSQAWKKLSPEHSNPTTDDDWLNLIKAYPTLLKRPILVNTEGKAIFGFDTTTWQQSLLLESNR